MEYFFYLLVFTIPWLALSPWQTVMGVPGGYIFVAMVMLFNLFLIIDNSRLIRWKNIKNMPLVIPLVFFLVANIVSLLRIFLLEGSGGLWGNNFKEVGYLFFAVLFYWGVVNFVNDEQKVRNTIRFFVAGAVLACLIGMLKLVLYMYGLPMGVAQTWTVPRLLAPAGESQVLGGFIITLLPLVLALILYRISYFKVLTGILSAFILLLALVMTFSAGAWAGFAAALVILLSMIGFYNLKQVLPVLLVFALTASSLFVIDKTAYPGYFKGFESITRKITGQFGSSVSRLTSETKAAQNTVDVPPKVETSKPVENLTVDPAVQLGHPKFDESVFSGAERSWFRGALWRMFKSSPVFGVGPGNFEKLYVEYRPEGAPVPLYNTKPHNQYMEILAETGLVGSLTFVSVIISIFSGIFTAWPGLSVGNRKLLAGLMASLAAVGVHGYAFGILVHIQIWLLVGLISVVTAFQNRGFTIRCWGEDRL